MNFGYKKGDSSVSLGKALSAKHSDNSMNSSHQGATPVDPEQDLQDKIDEIMSLAIENNKRF